MLSNKRKRDMSRLLDNFREKHSNSSVKYRLGEMPFNNAIELFNIDRLGFHRYPCSIFGHQLVHKIVDELLDTGD